jgi:hypothetical protein
MIRNEQENVKRKSKENEKENQKKSKNFHLFTITWHLAHTQSTQKVSLPPQAEPCIALDAQDPR